MTEREEKILEIISEQVGLGSDEISRDTDFINDIDVDSLDSVELVMEFEEEFEISIPDDDIEKIKTVGDVIDYINEKKPEGP